MSHESLKEDELDWETLKYFTQGLIEVAKVNGITTEEKNYMKAFFEEAANSLNESPKASFEDLIDEPFSLEEAKKMLDTDELKEYFLKSCVLLACIDTFTETEKKLIKTFAFNLNFSEDKLNKVIHDVQNELLAQFSGITIYKDSLDEVARSIGVEDSNG